MVSILFYLISSKKVAPLLIIVEKNGLTVLKWYEKKA
jgi:hypothetical protein